MLIDPLDDPAATFVRSRPMNLRVGSDRSFAFSREFLKTCHRPLTTMPSQVSTYRRWGRRRASKTYVHYRQIIQLLYPELFLGWRSRLQDN